MDLTLCRRISIFNIQYSVRFTFNQELLNHHQRRFFMKKWVQAGVVGVSMISLIGCGGAMINIRSLKPANIHLGQSPEIGVASIEGGRRNQQDAVVEELVAKSRAGGFFLIRDRKGEGIKFDIRNGAPVMTGAQVTMGSNDIFLSGNIIESEAEKGEEQREKTRSIKRDGKNVSEKYTVTVPIFSGSAIVAFTLVSGDRVYMEQKEYAGKAKVDIDAKSSLTKDDLKEMAIKNAVSLLLNDITPSYLSSSVNMDKSDKGQKEILATARRGDIATAKQRL
jgi:hypothetical protein